MFEMSTSSPATQLTKSRKPAVWPLPNLNGRSPVVLGEPKSTGVDLAYARIDDGDLIETFRPGTSNGTPTHFMPSSLPAFAVNNGVIAYAGKQVHGHALLVDHGNGWASYYSNLEHMFATPTDRLTSRAAKVSAGDVLGHVGAPEPGKLKCLHFELWRLGDDQHYERIDPTQHMTSWRLLPWTDDRLTPTRSAAKIAA